MDWKIALKVGGPSVLAAWLFHALIIHYLDTSAIFKSNIYLNILLIVIIFAFCSWMGWLWIRMNDTSNSPMSSVIEENVITRNKVGSDLEIGSENSDVKKNAIKNNKVDGNLKIG